MVRTEIRRVQTGAADADIADIEDIVRPCGLFRTKADSIKRACIMLRDDFGGLLPDTMDELLTLPGVGRKTANLIVGDVYKKPAVVADTHLIRMSNRLGYAKKDDTPLEIEKKYTKEEPKEQPKSEPKKVEPKQEKKIDPIKKATQL